MADLTAAVYSAAWYGYENDTVVTCLGGTYTIGVDAFATYQAALAAVDNDPAKLSSPDVYVSANADWENLTEGTEVSVVRADGSTVTATIGTDAFYCASVTTQATASAFATLSTTIKNAGKVMYILDGSSTYTNGNYGGTMVVSGAATVIGNGSAAGDYVKDLTAPNSTNSNTRFYVLNGGTVGDLRFGGRATSTNAYVYVGTGGLAGTIFGSYSGTLNNAKILIDGGSFGSIFGAGPGGGSVNSLTVTLKNAYSSSVSTNNTGAGILAAYNSGNTGSAFKGDFNVTLTGSTIRGDIGIAFRSGSTIARNGKTFYVSLTDSVVGNSFSTNSTGWIGTASCYAMVDDFAVTVAGSSITGGIYGSTLFTNVYGGTACITGGTKSDGTVITEPTYIEFAKLQQQGGSRAFNDDGTISVKSATAYLDSETITGATLSVTGGTANRKRLYVTADGASTTTTIGRLYGMDEIIIDANAYLYVNTDFTYYSATNFTIDATNYNGTTDKAVFYSAPSWSGSNSYTVIENGTTSSRYSAYMSNKKLYIQVKPAYFSLGWADLEDGTVVTTPKGDGVIGEDAFSSYAEAAAYSSNIVFCDTYYDASWKGGTVGTPITVEVPGNTFSATIDNTTFCNSLSTAQSKYVNSGGSAVIWKGGTLTGNRTAITSLNGKKTIIYDVVSAAFNNVDLAPIVVCDTSAAGTIKTGELIVGAGSRVAVVYGNRNGSTAADIVFSVTVEENGYVCYLATNFAGTVGSSDTYTVNATTGKLDWDGTGSHSTATFNVKGGSVSVVYPSIYSGGYTGDVVVNVSENGKVGSVIGRNVSTVNGNFYVNLSGGTVNTINGVSGNGTRYFEVTVSGNATSRIGTFSNFTAISGYAITVKATEGASLSLGSDFSGTITIDNTGFAFAESQKTFTVIAGDSSISSLQYVLTDAEHADYDVIRDDTSITFSVKSIGYSAAWKDLTDGTVVVTGFGTYTIGEDAFGNYNTAADTAESMNRVVRNYDVYFSSDWSGKTGEVDVVLDGTTVTATIGKNAFTSQSAAYTAMDSSAAVVFEGGSYSGTEAGSFQLGGKRTIFEGGTYSGHVFAGTSSDSISTVDLTVNNAVVAGRINIDRYAICTGTANIHISGSSVGSLMTGSYSTDTCATTILVENNSTIGAIAASFGGNSNLIDITIKDSRVTGYFGGAGMNNSSNVTGDVNFTFSGATVNQFSAGRGTDTSQWKNSRVTGDVAIRVTGGTSVFTYFDAAKYVTSSMAVTIDAGATLVATEFAGGSADSITFNDNVTVTSSSFSATSVTTFTIGDNFTFSSGAFNVSNAGTLTIGDNASITASTFNVSNAGSFTIGNNASISTGTFNFTGLNFTIDAASTITATSSFTGTSGATITIDVDGFELGTGINSHTVISSGVSLASYTFTSSGELDDKYELVVYDKSVAIERKKVVYSAKFANYKTGDVVTFDGNTYTIGTNAFGNYTTAQDTATANGYLFVFADNYFSPLWTDSEAESFDVVLPGGETVTLNVGENAFKTYSGASNATPADGTFFTYGGTCKWGDGTRADYFTKDGQTWIFQDHLDVGTLYNGAYSTHAYGGTVALYNTYLHLLNGYGSTSRSNKDLTVILDSESCIGTLYSGIVASTSTYSIDSDGKYVWDDATKVSTTNFIVNGGSVSEMRIGAYSSAATGDFNVTLTGATVGSLYAAGEFEGGKTIGNEIITVSGSTIGTINYNGASIADSHYLELNFTAGTSYVGSFTGKTARLSGMAINIDAANRARLDVGNAFTGIYSNAVITVDVENFALAADEDYFLVATAPSGVNKRTFTVDTASLEADGYYFLQNDRAALISRYPVYFSQAWRGLADTTTVTTKEGSAEIGTNAFYSYADACAKAEETDGTVRSTDAFFSWDWTNKKTGDEVTFVTAGGSVTTTIGDYAVQAFNSLADARAAAAEAGCVLEIVGGSSAFTGRTSWDDVPATILTHATITRSGSYAGAPVTMFNGDFNDATYETSFTVGEGGYVAGIGSCGNINTATFKSVTYNVVDGGMVGSIGIIGYCGVVTGDVFINFDGGSGSVYFCETSAGASTNSSLTGNVNISLKNNSFLSSLALQPNTNQTLDLNGDITVALASSTINTIVYEDATRKLQKSEGSTIDMIVSGTSLVGTWDGAYIDSVTLNDNASLTVNSGNIYTTAGFTLGENATIAHTGSVSRAAAIALGNDASFTVSGSVTADSITLASGATLTVGGTLTASTGITIKADASLVIGGALSCDTITIDATDLTLTEDRYLLLSTSSDLTDRNITVNGSVEGYQLVKDGGKLYYQKGVAYFSAGWAGLADETIVTTPGGTAKIGTDAFATYDEAVASGKPVVSADVYFNFGWSEKSTGDTVTVETTGGTFDTQIAATQDYRYNAYTGFTTAWNAVRGGYGNANVLYITGGSTSGDVSSRVILKGQKTVITGTTITTREVIGADEFEMAAGGTTCLVIGKDSDITYVYAGGRYTFDGLTQVYVRDNAKITSLCGAGTNCDGIGNVVIDVDGGTTQANVDNIYGGGMGSYTGDVSINVKKATGTRIFGANMVASGTFTGNIDIALENATYTYVYGGGAGCYVYGDTLNISLTGSTITGSLTADGDTNGRTMVASRTISVKDSWIQQIVGFMSETGDMNITLDNTFVEMSVSGRDACGGEFGDVSATLKNGSYVTRYFYGIQAGTATNLDVDFTGSTVMLGATIVGASAEVTGDVTLDIANSYVGVNVAVTAATSVIGGTATVNVTGSTVCTGISNAATQTGGAYITLADGTEIVSGGVTGFDKVLVSSGTVKVKGSISNSTTINVDATLVVDGTIGGDTITVDAENCDYSKARYILIEGSAPITNNITVINEDTSKEYEIVKSGNFVYYQQKPVYFSVAWDGLTAGTEVTYQGKTLTIGKDAFATYAQAGTSGRAFIYAAETYLNSAYNSTDPITVDGYTATYGTDAFNTLSSAVTAATTAGNALRVTGGSFSELHSMEGVTDVEIKNVTTTNSVHIQQVATTNVDKLNVNMADTNVGNALQIVNSGTVSGNVSVTLNNVNAQSMYGVQSGTVTPTVTGDLAITISGTGMIKEGIYTVDGTVNGNVSVTLAGGTIGKRGIHIRGTVDGTSSITVTGNALVSVITGYDTVTINAGASLSYGTDDFSGKWDPAEYLHAVDTLVNNGTFYYNAEIGQNAYHTVVTSYSGEGTLSSTVGNVIFNNGGTTYYAAEYQDVMLVDTTLTDKSFLDVVTIGGTEYIYGISAFNNAEDAKNSQFHDDETVVMTVGSTVTTTVHGDGNIGFAGSTVTASAYAGTSVSSGTVSNNSSITVIGVEGTAGSYSSLIGGSDVKGDVTQTGSTSITVTGENNVKGKALVGSSYVTDGTLTFEGSTSSVTVESGSFSNIVAGGALVNQTGAKVAGTLNTNVVITGGTMKAVAGGCYIQCTESADDNMIAITGGTTNVTISGGVILTNVYGGNIGKNVNVSTAKSSKWGGSTNVTIDATNTVKICGSVIAGSYGKGQIGGNTHLTFTGDGANLTINGNIVGGSSSGTDGSKEGASGVTGTRTLTFDHFTGTLGSNVRKVIGFTNVEVNGGTVQIAGYGQLKSVSDWSITDGTIEWTKGTNDFSGDKLTLTYSGALTDEWTVFQLADGLTTNWDKCTLDESGDAKVALSIGGESTLAVFDDTANAYLGTINEVNYKFYLDTDDNALKVAKLA